MREYQKINKYVITAKCKSPLRTGSADRDSNSVLKDPLTRLPFIQASGISGILRAASLEVNGPVITNRLFGENCDSNTDGESSIILSDGNFYRESLKFELRPRVHIDPVSGTSSASLISGTSIKAGHKFETEAIGTGSEFYFTAYLFDDSLKGSFESLLSEIKEEHVQFGGQKSNGFGFVEVTSILHREFNMCSEKDRAAWADEENQPLSDITNKLEKAARSVLAYEITLNCRTEGTLLVKGIATDKFGYDTPSTESIKNSEGSFIVPGSSIKGTLKNRMTYIAKHMGVESILTDAFGKEAEKNNTGSTGSLLVHDAIVTDSTEKERTRIKIDKFTGGVVYKGTFKEQEVSGGLTIKISISRNRDSRSVAALTLLALRDLASGVFNLGSGYNIGRGFIEAECISIREMQTGKTACISYINKETDDKEGIIADCFGSLKNRS